MQAYARGVTRPDDAERGPRASRGNGDPFAAARTAMLETQLRARGVRDPRVLAAMAAVPREAFVPLDLQQRAYADEALPIDHGQTISQPLMVGLMTELLAPQPGEHVLDIGTGSGYQAAVLAAMGCLVTGIERIPELAAAARARLDALGYGDRVEVRDGDGSTGEPRGAPWPRILVAAAAPRVPPGLADQLADGGRLVLPVGERVEQVLVLVERHGARLRTTTHGGCVFVPLVGTGGFP
jgi:protein-L-isoaspartate(D-aspartate) O-methyltransferase